MKKKRAQARQPSPRKTRRAAAAPPPLPPEPPEPTGDDGTLSIEAMLRAQLAATHVAAMDCLRRAGTAESDEVRDQALTHATRLLSLFTRQVKTLEQGRWYAPAPARGARPVRDAAAPEIAAAAKAEVPATVGTQGGEKSPADDPAGIAALAQGGSQTPAPREAAVGGGP
jgi:hypothetical protein